jgi:hypothetical protein
MSRDQKPNRVRVVSSRSDADSPRRRRSDRDAPIIEIGGEREQHGATPIFAGSTGGEAWGISRATLLTFLAGCALGGVFSVLVAMFWGSVR